MKTRILDARTLKPGQSAEEFLAAFYGLEQTSLSVLKRTLFTSEEVVVTEVFNWPVDLPAWKTIASTLESVQQHSDNFYVIWGPETENAQKMELDKEALQKKTASKESA